LTLALQFNTIATTTIIVVGGAMVTGTVAGGELIGC